MSEATASVSTDETVLDIVEDVLRLQKKYQFNVNQSSVLSAAQDSSENLGLDATDAQLLAACRVLVPSYAA